MNLQSTHTAVSADDIASRVIVCGDPARAARIAGWCGNVQTKLPVIVSFSYLMHDLTV